MIYTVVLIVSVLVALNFVLLKFSCNKTTKKETISKPVIFTKPATSLTTESAQAQLAATGS